MVKSRLAKILLFWLVTWTIMNSFLLVCDAYFVCKYFVTGRGWVEAWESFAGWYCFGFVWAICLALPEIYHAVMAASQPFYVYIYNYIGVFVALMAYLILCFGPPLWLWWKKQTIPRACLLAVGATMGNPMYVYFIYSKGPKGLAAFFAMIAFYLLLGLFNWWRKKYRPDIDLSKYLIWRRPWT